MKPILSKTVTALALVFGAMSVAHATTYSYRVPAIGLQGGSTFAAGLPVAADFRVFELSGHSESYTDMAPVAGGWYAAGDITTGSNYNTWLTRFDADGGLAWSVKLADDKYEAASRVAVGPGGSAYVASVGTGSGWCCTYSMQKIAKFSPGGTVNWQYQIPYRTGGGGGFVAVDSTGAAIVATYRDNPNFGVYYGDTVLLKFDTNGNLLWQKLYGDTNANIAENPFGIVTDAANNFYVVGATSPTSNSGTFIAKFDPNGNVIWQKKWGGVNESFQAVVLDGAGNIYVGGRTYVGTAYGVVLLKFAPDGTLLWQNRLSSPIFPLFGGIALDFAGNPIITGQTSTGGKKAIFVAKYSSAGVLQWQNAVTGPGELSGRGLLLNADGRIYVTATGGSWTGAYQVRIPSDGTGLTTAGTYSYVAGEMVPSVPTFSVTDIAFPVANLSPTPEVTHRVVTPVASTITISP